MISSTPATLANPCWTIMLCWVIWDRGTRLEEVEVKKTMNWLVASNMMNICENTFPVTRKRVINKERKNHGMRSWVSTLLFSPWHNSPKWARAYLIIEVSLSHSDTPHSVWLIAMSDQPDAGTSIWQHTTLTRDRHLCPRRDLNPEFQQACGHRPTC